MQSFEHESSEMDDLITEATAAVADVKSLLPKFKDHFKNLQHRNAPNSPQTFKYRFDSLDKEVNALEDAINKRDKFLLSTKTTIVGNLLTELLRAGFLFGITYPSEKIDKSFIKEMREKLHEYGEKISEADVDAYQSTVASGGAKNKFEGNGTKEEKEESDEEYAPIGNDEEEYEEEHDDLAGLPPKKYKIEDAEVFSENAEDIEIGDLKKDLNSLFVELLKNKTSDLKQNLLERCISSVNQTDRIDLIDTLFRIATSIVLQRQEWGIGNTTQLGENLKDNINRPQYARIKEHYFAEKKDDEVRYRDLREYAVQRREVKVNSVAFFLHQQKTIISMSLKRDWMLLIDQFLLKRKQRGRLRSQ